MLLLCLSGGMGSLTVLGSSSLGAPDWMVQWFIQIVGLDTDAAYTATVVTRKLIHFTYFGLIALFAYLGAIRLTHDVKRSIAFALLWTATFAAFDELSQLASPKRTGSILDFGLDMLGAAVFVTLANQRFRPKSPA
jgi:VanZ family protein